MRLALLADTRGNPIAVDAVLADVEAQGYVTAAGWLDWLAALPFDQRLTLPDGTRLLGVHVAPDRNDGEGVHPRLAEAELRKMLDGCAADLLVVGHTHWPTERVLDGIRVVNVGSVSNPLAPDIRASYVILTATESGYEIEFRRVAYDYAAAIDAIERCRHPGGGYIIRHLQGLMTPWWAQSESPAR